MTSDKKHSPQPPKGQHKVTIDAYIRAGRHVIDERHAKTIRQIAEETGMATTTARYWLKRDHREEHLRWWPNVEMLIGEAAEEGRLFGQSLRLSVNLPLPDPDEIAAMQERGK